MGEFEIADNADGYRELANAVVAFACDDYRAYKRHFRKNEAVLSYINQRLGEVERHTEEYCRLQTVKEDTELEQRLLQSAIAEIEKFLLSPYGMLLSHGLGDVILERIQNEQPRRKLPAKIGEELFKKKEKKIPERLKKLFGRRKK